MTAPGRRRPARPPAPAPAGRAAGSRAAARREHDSAGQHGFGDRLERATAAHRSGPAGRPPRPRGEQQDGDDVGRRVPLDQGQRRAADQQGGAHAQHHALVQPQAGEACDDHDRDAATAVPGRPRSRCFGRPGRVVGGRPAPLEGRNGADQGVEIVVLAERVVRSRVSSLRASWTVSRCLSGVVWARRRAPAERAAERRSRPTAAAPGWPAGRAARACPSPARRRRRAGWERARRGCAAARPSTGEVSAAEVEDERVDVSAGPSPASNASGRTWTTW